MRKILFLFLFALTFANLFAENTPVVGWQISGRVVDEIGNPLAGASISVVNTFKGAVADRDGNFVIAKLPSGNYSLQVSFVGYSDTTIAVNLQGDINLKIQLSPSSTLGEEVVITALKASSKTPMTYSNLSVERIKDGNTVADLPLILGVLPSVVSTSESGGGIGNTAFRIRGTDPSRINVTLNGIPLNDAESQTVFWVDVPDIASSISSLQVERGVGSSTNGSGAFGGTVTIQTQAALPEPYATIDASYGAFNTQKLAFSAGSGLIHNRFSFDVRYSRQLTDGYVDHTGSDHTSMLISGAWLTERSVLKANFIMGEEHTDISWNGVPSYALDTNRRYNPSGLYYTDDGKLHRYNNETDNYWLNHYQLLYSLKLGGGFMLNLAGHLSPGRGYYEEYKDNKSLSSYGIADQQVGGALVSKSDLIQQKWLNNRFYGGTYSFSYKSGKAEVILGGGANRYDGNHFGKIKWVEKNQNIPYDYEWYKNRGVKDDFNSFLKVTVDLPAGFACFTDLQYRYIYYKMSGPDDDLVNLWQTDRWDFFNPKAGISFRHLNHKAYVSFAVANREPARSDLKDATKDGATVKPKSERLYDLELGYAYSTKSLVAKATLYYMRYRDQLVNTGKLNDVGYPLMTNVGKSYRRGVEVEASYAALSWLSVMGNLALSQNRIENFVEYVDLYDNPNDWNSLGQQSKNLGTTDISFSPNVVSAGAIILQPRKNVRLVFQEKYVGKQYIDNSSSSSRMLKAYEVLDSRLEYRFGYRSSSFSLMLLANNLLDKKYLVNGWIYRAKFGDGSPDYVEDGYFPQAGRNFAIRLVANF